MSPTALEALGMKLNQEPLFEESSLSIPLERGYADYLGLASNHCRVPRVMRWTHKDHSGRTLCGKADPRAVRETDSLRSRPHHSTIQGGTGMK